MAATTNTSTPLPQDILDAMEHGVVSQEQLQRIIEIEAADLGLNYDEAVRHAREDTLPKNIAGDYLRLLVSLLAA